MAPSPVINLDRELDRLFQAPFAEFVGARNGVAAMLKKAGRADESARVRGLAKPSYTAWLVNQLYWNARDVLDAFLKASDRVRAAEQALLEGRKAAGHADLVAARASALDQLMSRASTRAAEEGTPLSPALSERLKTTLEAIGAFGSTDARHARGRLQEDLDPPGFAAFAALASLSKPVARRRPQGATGRRSAGRAAASGGGPVGGPRQRGATGRRRGTRGAARRAGRRRARAGRVHRRQRRRAQGAAGRRRRQGTAGRRAARDEICRSRSGRDDRRSQGASSRRAQGRDRRGGRGKGSRTRHAGRRH